MYIPHTDAERQEMLKTIGSGSIEDLFQDIPEAYRFPNLDLPSGLSEMEVLDQMKLMAEANNSTEELLCFLGAGAYDHYVPAAVDMLLRRGDFFSAYTPYQPEISQGTLQAIFEYQTLISNLTGMEISNASHYDGATAAAETVITAYYHFRKKRKSILVSPFIHPDYLAVIKTYLRAIDDIKIIVPEAKSPEDFFALAEKEINQDTALLLVQYPDFLGNIIDYESLFKSVHEAGGLTASIIYPLALGLLRSPSTMGVDFIVGEGQSLGLPLSFGGPYLGFFATKKEFIRKISGRIVGETVDQDNKRGYVLTLTAREQHIRREKATSNICSNQGLNALAVAIYLSLLGKSGLKEVANICYQKAHYLADQISQIDGFKVINESPFFNEFIVQCPGEAAEIAVKLLHLGILAGFDLQKFDQSRKDQLLVAVTEKITREDLDYFVENLREVANA
jgi:glycine dehydrogenase subunit 1